METIRLTIGLGAIAALAVILLGSCASLEKEAYKDIELAKSAPDEYRQNGGTETPITGEKTATISGETTSNATPNEWIAIIPGRAGTPITEADLASLPEPARRYFAHAGVVGKPRIESFSLVIEGRIRNSPTDPWMALLMRQYNRIDAPARVVYIESPGKPMSGVDSYLDGKGRMHIKIAELFTISDNTGPEMDVSALVTFMNDLMLCPQAAFSLPLEWRAAGENAVELRFTHRGITAKAILTIGSQGELVNWESEDRYAEVKGKNLKDKWSTPISRETELSGLHVPSVGQGIHDYDGTPFVYLELDRVSALTLDAQGLPDRLNKTEKSR